MQMQMQMQMQIKIKKHDCITLHLFPANERTKTKSSHTLPPNRSSITQVSSSYSFVPMHTLCAPSDHAPASVSRRAHLTRSPSFAGFKTVRDMSEGFDFLTMDLPLDDPPHDARGRVRVRPRPSCRTQSLWLVMATNVSSFWQRRSCMRKS